MIDNLADCGLCHIEQSERILFEGGFKPVWRISNIAAGSARDVISAARADGLAAVQNLSGGYRFDSRGLLDFGAGADLTWVFVSREKTLAAEAARIDALEKNAPEPDVLIKAMRRMGELLGYPECCATAYSLLPRFTHQTAHMLWPHFNTFDAPDHLLNRFAGIQLISHSPCSFNCMPSHELATFVLDAIRKQNESEAAVLEAWKKQPLLLFDHHLWLTLDGESDGVTAKYINVDKADATGKTAEDVSRLKNIMEKISEGDTLSARGGALTIYSRGEVVCRLGPDETFGRTPFLLHWTQPPAPRAFRPSVMIVLDGQLAEAAQDEMSRVGIDWEAQPASTGANELISRARERSHNIAVFGAGADDGTPRDVARAGINVILFGANQVEPREYAASVHDDPNSLLAAIRELSMFGTLSA